MSESSKLHAAGGMQSAGGFTYCRWRAMDRGPVLDWGRSVWCITRGYPRDIVLATFAEMLAVGDFNWVILPLPSGAGHELPRADVLVVSR